MNKILVKRSVDGNEFYTNIILSTIEQSNNKILSVMENVTTSNGNEDGLLKDKERKDLCLIDEGEIVVDPGTK